MNTYDVKRLALILAKQAEIEAMKADNSVAVINGCMIPYCGDVFLDKANDLENLANIPDEQL